jgi:hypothetical protein
MATRINYTDQQLLDYSEEHLLYELHMLRWAAENLPQDKGFLLSARLESFAIHFRNLVDFFYTEPVNARNDDLVADDFFDSSNTWNIGPIPQALREARERANKEINHITYKRKAAMDPAKPWPVKNLFEQVHSVAEKFADTASSTKLHPKVVRWLKSDPIVRVSLIASASTSSSNTASVLVGPGGAVPSANNAIIPKPQLRR